jgi:hypothetical protein
VTRLRLAVVSALVVVPLILAGCSKSSSATAPTGSASASVSAGLSASDYVVGVCGAFQDYADSVKQRQSGFAPTGADIAAVKQSWLDFLDGMIQDTQTLVTKIEALGVPDVSDGQGPGVDPEGRLHHAPVGSPEAPRSVGRSAHHEPSLVHCGVPTAPSAVPDRPDGFRTGPEEVHG